jgi:glycosyltransferase involved in cell wall biosynthesis
MTLPLSVFLIAKDEEARLARTLEAVADWADEIIVVDSGSTDRTLDIARHYGAKTFQHGWRGYGPQKRFAEQQCRNDWIFNVDADELVTPALKQEIVALFASGEPIPAAYRIRILNVYPGRAKPRWLANDYNVVRLYHRKAGSYRDHPVFDRVTVTGPECRLSAPIWHYPHVSIEHALDKANRFSSFRAGETKRRSQIGLMMRLVIEFPLTFAKFYLLRRHCFGGWRGFYFSAAQAFMRLTRIAKALEAAASR